ncbi:hypothetical protein JXA12_00760 [Candidatus Woesearchaeota archaeon]|nr:hypothetical protein [Candidatus Woesearchaeota archaeon]
MTLDEDIDEKHGLITVTGKPKDIKRFAYSLEQAISKGRLREELDDLIEAVEKGGTYSNQFNFTAYHRMYYEPGKILFAPNAHDKQFWFPLIKKSYDEAKKIHKNEEERR